MLEDCLTVHDEWGDYRLTVRGYSRLPHACGAHTKSPYFHMHGDTWQLKLSPGGRNDKHKDHVALILFRERPSTMDVRDIKMRMKVVCQHRLGKDVACTFGTCTLSYTHGHGPLRLVRTVDLLDPARGLCVDDCVIFEVSIGVEVTTTMKTTTSDLRSATLARLFHSEDCSDFTIIAEDRHIRTHRVVLSTRSPVLRAMLWTDNVESRSGEWHIDDLPYEAVLAFVRYFYTNEISILRDPCALLQMAVKYEVHDLIERLESALVLTNHNVVAVLVTADAIGAVSLHRVALTYMRQHFIVEPDTYCAKRSRDILNATLRPASWCCVC